MKQSAPGNIILICDGCGQPLQISPLQEGAIDFIKGFICLSCNHIHTDLEELKNYAKQTKKYGHM